MSGEASFGFCSRDVRSFTAGSPGIADPIAGGAARSTGGSATRAPSAVPKTIVATFFVGSLTAGSLPELAVAGAAGGGWLCPGRGGAFLPPATPATEDELGEGGRFGVVASTERGLAELAGASAEALEALEAFAAGREASLAAEAGATPPFGSLERGSRAVIGMSSGARFTTKRTRARGSTAR